MDIKEYIDQFPEIADRERHEQFTLLEKARDTSFNPPAKRLFQMYCWLLPVFMIFGLGGILYSFFWLRQLAAHSRFVAWPYYLPAND